MLAANFCRVELVCKPLMPQNERKTKTECFTLRQGYGPSKLYLPVNYDFVF